MMYAKVYVAVDSEKRVAENATWLDQGRRHRFKSRPRQRQRRRQPDGVRTQTLTLTTNVLEEE